MRHSLFSKELEKVHALHVQDTPVVAIAVVERHVVAVYDGGAIASCEVAS